MTPLDYRAEIAKVLHEAAATGIIPGKIILKRHTAEIDLSVPAECCHYVDHLLRCDRGRRWAYMGPLPGFPGLQPELGDAIGALRELVLAERQQTAAQRHLDALRQRTAGIRAAREALLAQWNAPIEAVHAAGQPITHP